MTPSLNPRVQRIIKWQNTAMIANAIIAVTFSIFVIAPLFDYVTAFFIALLTAWVLIRVLNAITLLSLQFLFYGAKFQELAHDAAEAAKFFNEQAADTGSTVNRLALKIVATPEKPMGRFMDAEFYEWIDVEGVGREGEIHRFSFNGTMDLSRGIVCPIPDNCILFPPGILYQVVTPVNIAA